MWTVCWGLSGDHAHCTHLHLTRRHRSLSLPCLKSATHNDQAVFSTPSRLRPFFLLLFLLKLSPLSLRKTDPSCCHQVFIRKGSYPFSNNEHSSEDGAVAQTSSPLLPYEDPHQDPVIMVLTDCSNSFLFKFPGGLLPTLSSTRANHCYLEETGFLSAVC